MINMRITKDNYEQYFLDHAEGNLSPEMERELADFLDANPDLRAVLSELDPSPLPTVETRNEHLKKRLKKNPVHTGHISENNIDEWLIREMEGLLDDDEDKELQKFLSLNPAYSYDQKKFRQAKLVPDLTVTFSRKDSMKKKAAVLPIVRLAWLIPAAAAVVILFIGIRFFLQQPGEIITIPAESPDAIVSVAEKETPSQLTETPSRSDETPSHGMESPGPRTASFRLQSFTTHEVMHTGLDETRLEPELVAYNVTPIQTIETKDKPLIAKVFSNMIAKARSGFSRNSGLEEIDLPDFSFWAMAKAGIEGYNSISDRELELLVRKDDEGKVKAYALIDEERLILSKELNKE